MLGGCSVIIQKKTKQLLSVAVGTVGAKKQSHRISALRNRCLLACDAYIVVVVAVVEGANLHPIFHPTA